MEVILLAAEFDELLILAGLLLLPPDLADNCRGTVSERVAPRCGRRAILP